MSKVQCYTYSEEKEPATQIARTNVTNTTSAQSSAGHVAHSWFLISPALINQWSSSPLSPLQLSGRACLQTLSFSWMTREIFSVGQESTYPTVSYTSSCETLLECQQTGSLGLAPALEAENSLSPHEQEAQSQQQVDVLWKVKWQSRGALLLSRPGLHSQLCAQTAHCSLSAKQVQHPCLPPGVHYGVMW